MKSEAAERLASLWNRGATALNLPEGLIGKVLELIPEPDLWVATEDGPALYILAGDALFLVTVNQTQTPSVIRRQLKGERVVAGIEWEQNTTDGG